MRTGALLLAILMIAAAPTAALAAKKPAAPAAPAKFDTTPANTMDSTTRLFRDGLPKAFGAAAPAAQPAAAAPAPKKGREGKKELTRTI